MKKLIATTILLALAILATTAHAQTALPLFNAVQTDSGTSVSATSTYSPRFSADYAVNGDTTGYIYNDGSGQPGTDRPSRGFWNSGNAERYGTSSLTISLSRGYLVREIDVYGARNDYNTEREPTDTEDSVYANSDFDVLTSRNGIDYGLACSFRGNTKVINVCSLDPFNTVRYVRVTIFSGSLGFARIAEVRALARQ